MIKTLLVGLDAACWEYIGPLLQAGRLPNLEMLISQGSSGTLRSVMPPITPAAWSSLVTGVNPGKHGIFEWVHRRREDYQFVPVNARQRFGTPIWRRLNAAGIRTGVVNIPLTFPVEKVDGFLLCGFSAPPGSRNLAYPPEVLDKVEAKFGSYRPDVEMPAEGHWSPEAYLTEREFQARLVRIAAHLAESHQVHVLIINLMLLDHANHTMHDFMMVEQAIVDTDTDLGFLLSEFAPDNVMVISDHGSRRIKGVFLLGAWLAENGYLSRAPRPFHEQSQVINYLLTQWRNGSSSLLSRAQHRLMREFLLHVPSAFTSPLWSRLENAIPFSIMDAKTTNHFSPDKTRVFPPGSHRGNLTLNLIGREPQGIVLMDEKEALLE